VMISTFLCGVIFATFGGQGMVIVGVTGPVCIFAQTVYKLADSLDEPFLPWMAWIAVWACIMHLTVALCGLCHFVSWVTPYACETFGSLIGIIYVWTAFADLVKFFDEVSRASAMWSVIICLGTHHCAEQLANARSWTSFGELTRDTVANYAVPISIMVWTVLSIVVRDQLDVDTPRIEVADSFGPTMKDRPWLVDLGDCSGGGVFLAIVPAAVLTVLFFFDHNVSSLMAQAPEFNLKKPPAYNWDFFVIGLMIFMCGILGIPFTNGLIPQAPLHVHALSTQAKVVREDGQVHDEVVDVKETRLSNFSHAFVVGFCMTPPALKLLQSVPLPALSGLFLFMGMGCFKGNGFINRVFLPIQDPTIRSAVDYGRLENLLATPKGTREIHLFTLLQFIIWVCIYGVTKTPAAISFPIWIASLVGLRWGLLPKVFSEEVIEAIDGKDEHEILDHHMEHDKPGNWDGVTNGEEDLTHHTGGLHYAFAHEHQKTKLENDILLRANDEVIKQRSSIRSLTGSISLLPAAGSDRNMDQTMD